MIEQPLPQPQQEDIGKLSSEPPVETVSEVETLQLEIKRLQFDTLDLKIPTVNFDPVTGEDLRTDEIKRYKTIRDMMLRRAEKDMQTVLGHREGTRFSKYTGNQIPERDIKGKGDGIATNESLQARLDVFRKDAGYLVEKAREKGVQVPRFDSETGDKIPQDSLRALEASRELETPVTDDMAQLRQELNIGLEALSEMKRIRREDERARRRKGLPSRE